MCAAASAQSHCVVCVVCVVVVVVVVAVGLESAHGERAPRGRKVDRERDDVEAEEAHVALRQLVQVRHSLGQVATHHVHVIGEGE